MAVTDGKAVAQGAYVVAKRDTALANAGTIIVTHAKDDLGARQCELILVSDGNMISRIAANYTVKHTSTTTTTFTNVGLGTVDVKAVVVVPANTGALA